MYVLFEDAGRFHAGRVMSEAEASLQVELDSGKRVKIKSAAAMLRFERPSPAELLREAQALAREVDLDLAWEFAAEGDFDFKALAGDYFGADAGAAQQLVHQAAALFALFDAPHYFRRLGKGQFRKAPEEIVRAALLAIERKKQIAAQIDGWAGELVAGRCPAPVAEQLYRILFKPDKNGPEYKAVVEAAKRSQRSPLDLLKDAGAISSAYQFHWRRFLFEQFPHGVGFGAAAPSAPPIDGELPLAAVAAFSIDDSATTEIDDALSVQGLGSGEVTFGIHIAAPALAITPDSALDQVARTRLSTVYMPGWKITMLPDAVVQAYTLTEGRDCPAVSLYVTLDEATLAIRRRETRIERVPIVANLRHDQLDELITEAALEGHTAAAMSGMAGADSAPAPFPQADELAFAWRLAKHLKAGREAVRGKPETFNRPDYNFKLLREDSSKEPRGDETVQIGTRRRGAPLDMIVAEAMILANSSWGALLAERGVPGIYRSQASLAPGVKVRMGAKPLPHAGMGVAHYTWATSPLRRYVDLVNQWQIVACARHGATAALAAPFKPRDASLFAVISSFDAAYTAYADFQQGIERYWTLQWLAQNGIAELEARVMKEGLVRADTLPLVFRLPGTESLLRGTAVRARIAGIDLLTLELHATFAGVVVEAAGAAEPGTEADVEADDEDSGAPVTLAITLEDTEAPTPGSASTPAAAAGSAA